MKSFFESCNFVKQIKGGIPRVNSPDARLTAARFSTVLALLACASFAKGSSISGKVYDIVTGQALAGITISAENIDSVPRDSFPADSFYPFYYDTISDGDGNFTLRGLPLGRYSVYECSTRSQYPEVIDTYDGMDDSGIDIGLRLSSRDTARVSGEVRLLDSFGYPWFGEVTVFSASGQILGQTFVMPDDSTPVNPSDTIFPSFKSYEIAGLPPVPSKVCASIYGYLPQYYSLAYEADSTAVFVNPTAKDVNFSVELCGDNTFYYGEISGIIRGSQGPLPYSFIYAKKDNKLIMGSVSVFDGSYDIYGLEPGTYTIYATRPGYYTKIYGSSITIADQWVDGIDIKLERDTSGVVEDPDADLEQDFFLECFPNPFTSSTTIKYIISHSGPLSFKVYDATGRLVRTLVEGIVQAGEHTLRWDGTDSRGQMLPSGVYFARLELSGQASSKSLLVIR